jgi:hypothetical protein
VKELGAVGSFLRPNLVNGHYWHSNYWTPLYSLHEELGVTLGFHEGTGAWYSHMNVLYGENRFYRHVASHWIEMQQALIAMLDFQAARYLMKGEVPPQVGNMTPAWCSGLCRLSGGRPNTASAAPTNRPATASQVTAR